MGGEVIGEMKDGAGGKYQAALDNTLQFADIARPWIFLEQSHNFFGNCSNLLPQFSSVSCDKGFYQKRYIFLAVPQGRDYDGEYIQSIKKVLSEPSIADFLLKVYYWSML